MTERTPGAAMPLASDRVAEVLVRIVETRRRRVVGGGLGLGPPPAASPSFLESFAPGANRFLGALHARAGRAVIAEVKMGSPRLGSLEGRVDPLAQAQIYRDGGAAALSVVVEPDFFHGSYELLARCREVSGLPAIAKDFVVDPVQLSWAAEAGADAVLLVAALYDRETLHRLAARARSLGLVPLVETHDPADLGLLDGAGWELVGVNNRDLRTFEVDLAHAEAMAPRLPATALRVAESGIAGAADVERLRRAGFGAFLIGESLLLA
ncbi:MAG: indole-3-glycerol-phosphate synthase, partial [Acidobacteria bacterium]|nr:indole-3-glycerol-phosphate synthase [Acidobacteriota bacterium]